MNETIGALLQSNTRLIFLNRIGSASDAQAYDCYSDELYQTTDVNNILKALNGMNPSPPAGKSYTVLELQGTATGTGGGIFGSIATMSDASSPLMSTKPGFDQATYSWLAAHAPDFWPEYLMVFLNDFADGALSSFSKRLTAQRLRNIANCYVPEGTYRQTSKNISITIHANCVDEAGTPVPSSVTYSFEQALAVKDIANMNGTLLAGFDTNTGLIPNHVDKWPRFVPMGSYQSTCRDVGVTIDALCQNGAGAWVNSTLSYSADSSTGFADIANMSGSLAAVK